MTGEDSKSASPASSLRGVVWLLAWMAVAVPLVALLWCANFFLRFDLQFHLIDRYIVETSGGRDGHFGLVPAVFHLDQSVASAAAELEAAGYHRYNDGIFLKDQESLPDRPIVYGKGGGSGITRLICSVDFLVILAANDNKRLTSATAHVQSACL